MTIVKLFALSLAVNPYVYAMLNPLIQKFREKPPVRDFEVKKITNFQAAVALSLLENFYKSAQQRYNNAMNIISGLKDIKGIRIPDINENAQPAFNRLPLVFEDLSKKEKAAEELLKAGIETSSMYYKPLHHLLDLGYKQDDFPNATYFAEHLLTVPCHSMLTENDIEKIISIIKTI